METMHLEITGAVARLTLDRPRVLNAGNRQWVADLNEAVRRLEREPEARVMVLTGAGRAFSTGVDLKELAAGDFTFADFVAWEDAMVSIERMDRLVIAGINGHCLGGGLQLTLVCDYRLASEDALLGLPAVKECLIPSLALYRLPRLIGAARAKELILLGEPISAHEAERYGLVNRVVPAVDFGRALDETVQRFLGLTLQERARQQAPHHPRLRHGPRPVPRRHAGALAGVPGVGRASPRDGGAETGNGTATGAVEAVRSPASKRLPAGRRPCIRVGGGDGDGIPRYRPVTDFLPDTPTVARPYCPDCEPDTDPCREILDVRWCAAHTPAWSGADDAVVRTEAFLSGSTEAGGDDNRRWCQLLHSPGRVTASATVSGARRRTGRTSARTAPGP